MTSENTETKQQIVEKFRLHPEDVGSPEVQIALLTDRIKNLTTHFETNKEDKHSKHGMMKLISRRKALLSYLKNENIERYRSTLAALGLRK
jgi:small subunit ribosomal protein S15